MPSQHNNMQHERDVCLLTAGDFLHHVWSDRHVGRSRTLPNHIPQMKTLTMLIRHSVLLQGKSYVTEISCYPT